MVPVIWQRRPEVAIVGAGLFGLVVAEHLTRLTPGLRVQITEASSRIGGLCVSDIDPRTGVSFHPHGTNVLATSDRQVWAYVRSRTTAVELRPRAYTSYNGALLPMPLGLEAIEACFGAPLTPEQARRLVKADAAEHQCQPPATAEQAALAALGPRLYEAFVRGLLAKQWGDPTTVTADVFTDHFTLRYAPTAEDTGARWQGLPGGGWGPMLDRLTEHRGISVVLNHRASAADPPPFSRACVVTSPIDHWFGQDLGALERRRTTIDWRLVPAAQAPARGTVTYPDPDLPYYRTHTPALLGAAGAGPQLPGRRRALLVGFERADCAPVGRCGVHQADVTLRTPRNRALADTYLSRAAAQRQLTASGDPRVWFAGRGTGSHDDMGTTIAAALRLAETLARELAARTPPPGSRASWV